MLHSKSNFNIAGVNTVTNCRLSTVRKKSAYPIKCVIPNTIAVKQRLVKLKKNRECGPDLIHPTIIIIIELQAELVQPLDILNQSLQDGRLPLVWKQANMCPMCKKGDRAYLANNRPVSLMLCICKIL